MSNMSSVHWTLLTALWRICLMVLYSNVTRARFVNQMPNFTSDLLAPLSTPLTSAGPTTADIGKVFIAVGTSKIVKLQTVASKFPNAEIMSSSRGSCSS